MASLSTILLLSDVWGPFRDGGAKKGLTARTGKLSWMSETREGFNNSPAKRSTELTAYLIFFIMMLATCLGYAWNRMDRAPAIACLHWSPFHLFFSLFSCHCYCPMLDTAQYFKKQHKMGMTYAFQSWPFPPSLPRSFFLTVSFIFPLSYLCYLILSNGVYQHQAAITWHAHAHPSILFYLSLYMLILSQFNHHHWCPWGYLQYRS